MRNASSELIEESVVEVRVEVSRVVLGVDACDGTNKAQRIKSKGKGGATITTLQLTWLHRHFNKANATLSTLQLRGCTGLQQEWCNTHNTATDLAALALQRRANSTITATDLAALALQRKANATFTATDWTALALQQRRMQHSMPLTWLHWHFNERRMQHSLQMTGLHLHFTGRRVQHSQHCN
eukprot:4901767-Amphidinium_carterae.1